MEEAKKEERKKAGRPKKAMPLSEQLAVMCTKTDRAIIAGKARQSGRCVSAYLRELGINGQVEIKMRTVPKEILQLKGMLNHIAANINQIARKKNREEPFNALERAEAAEALSLTKDLIRKMEQYFKTKL